jgi:hypothetical protein
MAHADTSTNNEVFANAALRELHSLAVASAQSEQAAKDSDDLGCGNANRSMQKTAHEALADMHYMSFTPIDAIGHISELLRLIHLALPNGCPPEFEMSMHLWLMVAGQAIMSLRWDYAIGDGDWYTVKANGDIEAKDPLRYAQSLKDQNYSWVDVRPKGMIFMVESDWKAEMGSQNADDPSIENSGKSLKAVEVDYRKNSGDENTLVYFYRTKEAALAAAQITKQEAEDDAKTDAERKASDVEWSKKLTSLPYMVANHDVGFKLIYEVCKPITTARNKNICKYNGSHDWSDDHRMPYHWFSDMQQCKDAQYSINVKHPAGVKLSAGDVFVSDCVPASKMSGHSLRGYEMVVALSAPGAALDDNAYANLRENGSQTATVFKTFKACYDNMDTTYSKLMKDLGVNEDGTLLSDKTKSIALTANCVRIY